MSSEYVAGMPLDVSRALQTMMVRAHHYTPGGGMAPGTVVVCHSEPGAWVPARYDTTVCPPAGACVRAHAHAARLHRHPCALWRVVGCCLP